MPTSDPGAARQSFERDIKLTESQLANAAAYLSNHSKIRALYADEIRKMAEELRREVLNGKITWEAAAQRAVATQNELMYVLRSQSSAVGRAVAEQLKKQGLTFNERVAKYTVEAFGKIRISRRSLLNRQPAIFLGSSLQPAVPTRRSLRQLTHRGDWLGVFGV